MKKWKYLFIVAIIVFAAYKMIPTIRYYGMSAEARTALSKEDKAKFSDTAIKLGLDLQGGVHLVCELDDAELTEDEKKDAIDRVITIIRNRIDQFGVAEPVIQKQGDRRIIVQLPGVDDPERVKKLIREAAVMEFRLVRDNDEISRTLQDLDRVLRGVKVTATGVDSTEVENDNGTGDTTTADSVATDTPDLESTPFDTLLPSIPDIPEINAPLGGVDEERPFTSYLVANFGGAVAVDERNKETVDKLIATSQAQNAISRESEFLWATESQPLDDGRNALLLYLVEKKVMIKGERLVNATTRPDPDNPTALNVGFTFDREGGLIFSRWTGENIGRRIAIALDRRIKSAPVVQGKITGGEGRIIGDFSDEEASDLAIVLRAGALPAPINFIEERTVGPSLGRDSIFLGIRAMVIGFSIVLVFMLVYYRLSGLLACAALVLNLFLVLAVLVQLRAALTLPGMAGLILTIGMAVDANVLIFERIREELAKAKTVRSAIDSGYDRAFTTILDANITTLITAFVLWQFGTGPIKGFATVLSVGIIASMFTALMCTRVVFDMATRKRALRKLSI